MAEPTFGAYPPSRLQSLVIAGGRLLQPGIPGRWLASWIRSYISRTSTTPIDLTIFGQRMRLHPWDNACEKRLAVTPQFFDPVELAFIKRSMTPNFVFVDVGSNIGMYSIFVAMNAGPSATILALDPNEEVLRRLRFNAAANGLTNIVTRCVAVGDETKTIALRLGRQNLGGSSVLSNRDVGQASTTITVEMKPLADIVAECGLSRIDVLKIDIEGLEDRALGPFFNTAQRSLLPRALIIERNPKDWTSDVLGAAQQLGYRSVATAGKNIILALHVNATERPPLSRTD